MNTPTEIVYCYPTIAGEKYHELASRFLNSYCLYPPLALHTTTIILNGGHQPDDISPLFHALPNVKFFEHDNSGMDIGAYQAVSRLSTASMILFLTASSYFRRPGWLNRMAQAFQRHGNALYGAMGNRGDARVNCAPHVRSTGFWLSPALFNSYPHRITDNSQRYPFEHGKDCLTQWVYRQGLKVWVVGFDGEYEWAHWDMIPNGYHRGDQSNLLVGDHLTEPPFYHTP